MNDGDKGIRQSEDYLKARKIFESILLNVPIEYPRKRGVGVLPSPAEKFEKNCLEFYEKWQESKRISEILRGLKTRVEYPSDVYKSMSKLLVYLGLVESLGVALVDMALMLLIATGKEVHTRGAFTKHVTSFKELADIDLGYKLDFLESEGLDLFKRFINRDLRNHIAHLKFTIENNGEIRKRNGVPIHIDNEISRFWDGVDTLKLVLEDSGFLERLETASLLVKSERGNKP